MPDSEGPPKPILDTVVLRAMAFAHAQGIDVLLAALGAPVVRVATEVYVRDEDKLSLDEDDRDLSELARGLRFARRQIERRPLSEVRRYQSWLHNAHQLAVHLDQGSLIIDALTIEELAQREELRRDHGLGRGASASLVLVMRHAGRVLFLSSDEMACQAARRLGIDHVTLQDVLVAWVERLNPAPDALDAMVEGLKNAKFGLNPTFVQALRERLH